MMTAEAETGGIVQDEPLHPIKFQGESFITRAKRNLRKVVKNITLEPVMLFMAMVGSMDSVSVGQLLIDKTCHNQFNYTDETCKHLVEDEYDDENANVQNYVAQYKVYESIVDHTFPIICSFFLGSWSDYFGRKVILYVYFVFRLVDGSMLLLNAYFMEWPIEYLLFSVNLPVALSGGYLAYSMGINAFIADISKPEQRSFRMAMMHFVSSLGRPIGTQFGAYLWKTGGYTCVIGATLVGRAVGFTLLVVRLEMFRWKPKEREGESETKKKDSRGILSPMHIWDSIKTAIKPREGGKRFYLWIYFIVLISVILPWFGEMTIGFNYVRTRFGWEVPEYSTYSTISEIVDIVGQSICIPLLGYLQIRDSLLIPFLLSTIIARDFIKGFAKYEWMYYLGSGVNIMGGYAFAASRSIISKCVEQNELGKVFALLSAAESLVPIGMSQLYATVWKATQQLGDPWVGTVFFISGTLTGVALIISIFSLITLKGQAVADLDSSEICEARYRGPRIRRLSLIVKSKAWVRPPPGALNGRDNDAFDSDELPTAEDKNENSVEINDIVHPMPSDAADKA